MLDVCLCICNKVIFYPMTIFTYKIILYLTFDCVKENIILYMIISFDGNNDFKFLGLNFKS